ncbi:MAG: YebC/PmpR family DNA-binding transcriptional regulator, partial [Planctomycetota bacterium]
KKEMQDARKGKLFSKLIRLITTAAQSGGTNIDFNPKLELAIEKAKNAGISKDTIEKAINKAKDKANQSLQEVYFEGFGQQGVGIIVEVITDNKNRTLSEIRKIFDTKGGNLASANAVMWNFERKAFIRVPKKSVSSEEMFYENLLSSDVADLDIINADDSYEIYANPKSMAQVVEILNKFKYEISDKEFILKPKTTVEVKDKEEAQHLLELIDALEEHDDVQNVYSNFEIPEELLKSVAS